MPEKKDTTMRKTPSKRKARKGDSYICEVCGLSVMVDEESGLANDYDIFCCGQPMKEKKIKVKTAK